MSSIDPTSQHPDANSGFIFKPQSDITVAEMAVVMQMLLDAQHSVFFASAIDNLSTECKRHFISKRERELQAMLYLGASNT